MQVLKSSHRIRTFQIDAYSAHGTIVVGCRLRLPEAGAPFLRLDGGTEPRYVDERPLGRAGPAGYMWAIRPAAGCGIR